jgi:ubiquitin C-terminal hydrolase
MSWFNDLFSSKRRKSKGGLSADEFKKLSEEQIIELNAKNLELLKKDFSLDSYQSAEPIKGISGIENIGNTCFMGSALQCLSNIEYLTQYMLNMEWVQDINTLNSLGCQGRMVCEYYLLLRKLWIKKEKYVNPKMIKKQIQRSFNQFAGYDQQDSQEFLTHFLDLLHEDLNKILRKPYIAFEDYKGQPLQEFGKINWLIHQKRENSIISKIIFLKKLFIKQF